MTRSVVVVGTGLAGTRCATTLRRLAPEVHVTLVGDERCAPYERPPLSKEFLARAREAEDLTLAGAGLVQLADLGIDVRAGTRVTSLAAGRVELRGGDVLAADAIVLATGARPRVLPCDAPGERMHVLRTLDDAQRLREGLRTGGRLAIVGSGFIGAEVASTALDAGVDVTVLEAEAVPFARSLGAEVGTWLATRWGAARIDLRTGCAVSTITSSRDGVRVELGDGTGLDADQVLVAIGTRPNDELFHAAFEGLGTPGAGIPVDARGRTPIDGVWAAGDVALVAALDGARRVEHWTDAAAAAIAVAHDIAGAALPGRTAPYAWSDQFGVRLQVVGRPSGELLTHVTTVDGDAFLARYEDTGGRLCGIVAVGHPADVARYRRELAA